MRARSIAWTLVAVAAAAVVGGVAWRWGASGGGGSREGGRAVRSGTAGRGAVVGVVRRDGRPVAAWVELRRAFAADAEALHLHGPEGFLAHALGPPLCAARPDAVARAGDDGAYVASGLAPGVYDVRAVADDDGAGHAVATLPVDGARTAADVDVAPGRGAAWVSGRVRDAAGAPWRGLVSAERAAERGVERGVTSVPYAAVAVETDPQGRFRIDGLVPGPHRLALLEVGRLRAVGPVVEVGPPGAGPSTPVELSLGPRTGEIEGRTVSDVGGEAVPEVEVYAAGRGAGLDMVVRRTVSDAQGRWRLALPAGTERSLFALARDVAAWMGTVAEAGTAGAADVRLTRRGRLEGRVVALDGGAPVAGVRVTARPTRGAARGALPSAVTGADGRFAVEGVPPGDVVAAVEGGGWITERLVETLTDALGPATATVPPGGSATVDVRVRRAARVGGVVRDERGRPVEGATVRVELDLGGPPAVVATTATEADGTYAFDGLADGARGAVVAVAPDRRSVRSEAFDASATAPRRADVALPPWRAATVRVTKGGDDRPVPFARVVVLPADGGPAGPVRPFTADALGRAFVGPLPPGPASLRAEHEDCVRPVTATLAADAADATVRLEAGLALVGRVLDDDGAPAAVVRVGLKALDADGSQRPAVPTDGDGRFVFRGLARGRYVLSVLRRVPGEPERSGEAVADAGGEVTVRLARAAALADALVVRVFGPDGVRVPRARVRVREDGRLAWEGEAKDGVATVAGAPLAPRSVDVLAPAAADGTPLPLGPATVGPVLRGTSELEVRLAPAQRVAGVVVGPDDAPVAGVAVFAVVPGDDPSAAPTAGGQRAETDAAGRFVLAGQGAMDVALAFRVPDAFLAPGPVVARGGREDLKVVLRAAAQAVVTVVGPDGAPVAGVEVRVRRDGDAPASARTARTDAAGRATLRGLDPTRPSTLEVAAGDAPYFGDVRDAWVPADTTVRLEAARRLVVVVRDRAGTPLPTAVAWRTASRHGGAGGVPGGRVELRVPAAGDVVVCADPPGASTADRAAATRGCRTVRPHETEVELVVDLGADLVVRVEDPDGGPLPRFVLARVAARTGGASVRAATLERGRATFSGLAPDDRVSLLVPPDGRPRTALARDVAPGGEVVLRLAAGLEVGGRASVPPGAPEVAVTAHAEEFDATVQGTWSPDGRYVVAGLPEGTTWRIVVQATGGGRTAVGRSEPVPAGARDVDVVVR